MNKVILIGRICRDIETRQTPSGVDTCSFAIAINNGKDKDGNEREADFINCKAWRNTAKFISAWFSKGKMIAIEGKFKTDKYQDKNHSDITHYNSYVLVDNAEFCGSKADDNGGATVQAKHEAVSEVVQEALSDSDLSDFGEILSDDSEIPF